VTTTENQLLLNFNHNKMTDNESKLALVVGGTNGIGKGIAHKLASLGVKTVIVGRDKDKTEAVAKEIGAAEWLLVNVIDQADVVRLAADITSKYKHIDYLVLSAATLFNEKRVTKDGVDELLAVNHLWRFQLTNLLKDALIAAPNGARVLNVAGAGQNGDVFFDDPNFERTPWALIKALQQAQQLNDVFAVEAQRRWGTQGNGFNIHVLYPGQVYTKVIHNLGLLGFIFNMLIPFKKTIETTADQLVPLLLEPIGAHGGKLWGAPSFSSGPVRETTPAARVVDPEYGAKCWQLSESLIKVK